MQLLLFTFFTYRELLLFALSAPIDFFLPKLEPVVLVVVFMKLDFGVVC